MSKLHTINEVAQRQFCSGCGVCAAVAPRHIRMVDDLDQGRRPILLAAPGPESAIAAAVCPGIRLRHEFDRSDPSLDRSLLADWGPVYDVWEGYAADDEIRHAGSSGGAASALALYSLERGGMHGVLHTAVRLDVPYLNETVLSRTRAELLERTGSRYAPASPCDGLGLIESAPGPCVFIGKPCDVAGAMMAARHRPALAEKLGLAIAFFCAGTPTTRGTLDLLKSMGVPSPASLVGLRYRGNGWPGRFTAVYRNDRGELDESSRTYQKSWGFLTKYQQWRCRICPDHTGEFADIAVGDPWYRSVQPGEPGKSLIVARTRRGRDFLHAAAQAGYLVLETRDATLLPRSQPNLLKSRGMLWGRLLALRLAGVPTPHFSGFPVLRAWLRLTFNDKISSFAGTWRRIGERGLRKRRPVTPMAPVDASQPRSPASAPLGGSSS